MPTAINGVSDAALLWTEIEPAVPRPYLRANMAALPLTQCLLRQGGYEIWIATAGQLPAVLREIGRLREIAFRQVGEGTGKGIDLDRFDASYRHLFVWHPERGDVIGAYRLGLSDELRVTGGVQSFYTHTLFDYGDDFLDRISPAIELGRSFVRPEDQGTFHPLLLLWRGIAAVVAREPQYRRLFGPVSLSSALFSPAMRAELADRLLDSHGNDVLSAYVRPRHPLPAGATRVCALAGIPSAFGSNESPPVPPGDHRLPGLLRQYLALQGQLLAFSVDPAFNDALDGLVLVDLDRVDPFTLRRYMGAHAFRRFEERAPRSENAR